MVEVWEIQLVAKSPESAGKASRRTVHKGAGNDPSPRRLRKYLGKLGIIPKNGQAPCLLMVGRSQPSCDTH